MYISFSAQKLLFKNNLYELKESNCKLIINILIRILSKLKITVTLETIENASVRRVDYSKNFILYGENRSIYEILLGASHGSANKYKEENGKVIVTTFEKEEEKQIYENVISHIQDDMFAIYEKLEDLFINGYYDNKKISKKINKVHFDMLFSPSKEQLNFFNKIYHYENFGVFEFSKFNLKKDFTLKFYLKENAKYVLKRKSFFNDAFWPTLKLYNEKLYIPRITYKMYQKLRLIKKGVL